MPFPRFCISRLGKYHGHSTVRNQSLDYFCNLFRSFFWEKPKGEFGWYTANKEWRNKNVFKKVQFYAAWSFLITTLSQRIFGRGAGNFSTLNSYLYNCITYTLFFVSWIWYSFFTKTIGFCTELVTLKFN